MASGSVVSGGAQIVSAGGTAVGTVLAKGYVVVSGGSMSGASIGSGVTLAVLAGSAFGITVSSGGTLQFNPGAALSGTDVLLGGTLEFITEGSATSASVSFSSGSDVLTLTEGTAQFFATLSEPYLQGGEVFSATVINGGIDVLVTLSGAPCFRRGTRVLTDSGEVAVEDLRIGDGVVTVAGAVMPVRWIGHRRVDCRRHRAPEKVWPVRARLAARVGREKEAVLFFKKEPLSFFALREG